MVTQLCCVWFTDVCGLTSRFIWCFSMNRIADEIKHCKSLHFLNPEWWCYEQNCLKTHCLWLYRGFLKAWDQQASIGHLYHQSDHMVVLSPSSSTRRMLQLSAPAVVLKCDIPFFVISYDILLLSNFKAICSFSIIPWCAMKWKVYPTYLLPSKVLRSWFEIIVSYRLLYLFFFSSLS